MKSPGRPYTMRARADAAAETERRIIDAALELFSARLYDQVALADIAAAAGVSSQTVIRRFGSKEGLVAAVGDHAGAHVRAQRDEAPADDVAAAIANLVAHYEQEGDRVIHLLAQETRVPAFKELTDAGRALHYAWVDRVFAGHLAALSGADRRRRRGQLIATCDVYVWKVLRRDLGLSRRDVERALGGMVDGVLQEA